jgi:hypothetical protein
MGMTSTGGTMPPADVRTAAALAASKAIAHAFTAIASRYPDDFVRYKPGIATSPITPMISSL